MPNTTVITFLRYQDFFSQIEKRGLFIPISYLSDDDNIDNLVTHFIENFDSIEAISYSSFLNAIVQTKDAEQTTKIGWNEIKQCKLVHNIDIINNGLIFHRDNLLYIIAQLMSKDKAGQTRITGQKTSDNAATYYKAVLLINSKAVFSPPKSLSEQILLRDYFLRAYPYYYIPDEVENVYKMRFQRYWYVYNDLIEQFETNKMDKIKEGIELISKEFDLSLSDYFRVLIGIFIWFLNFPNTIRRNPLNNELKIAGFTYEKIETYYIEKQNFMGSDLFKLIKHLALDIDKFNSQLQKVRRDPIDGFYKDFQSFFDWPVFKINEDKFCIIDLKFLFEGICSGFFWRLNEISSKDLQGIKQQYGNLLEIYFVELLNKIFDKKLNKNGKFNGYPDAILETDTHILIFEFTVEYYRFASLYSEDLGLFFKDIYRLLFNEGKHDLNSRNKKDKGKFHKLDKYVEGHMSSKKVIIPILVTENYVGDYDLLDRFNNFLSDNIASKKLNNLKRNKPLIINLDDLENFWKISDLAKSSEQFIEFINNWKGLKDKGPYHFNFSYFMAETYNKQEIQNDFNDFFNWQEFIKI